MRSFSRRLLLLGGSTLVAARFVVYPSGHSGEKELEFIYALLDLLIRSKFDLNSFTHRELVNIEVGTILYSNNYSATVLPDFHRSSSCIPHHRKSKIKVLVKF